MNPEDNNQEWKACVDKATQAALHDFMNLTAGELIKRGLIKSHEGSELWQAWCKFCEEEAAARAEREYVDVSWQKFVDEQGGPAAWQQLTKAEQRKRVQAAMAKPKES